ncbi:ATP-binding cassette domain-containing protein [Cellulophaga omnivescoria]|uniref:ATP-binding cassette domain-containing protein n=1 Tax=Cellulophaga omnivescoria TaxID=1888890 RepID=UPI000985952A|nr:ATP-binding cassette domain-containing protein [Cellulophaga omnivescoria]
MQHHITIFTSNQSNTKLFIDSLSKKNNADFDFLSNKKVLFFSKSEIHKFIKEEEIHDIKTITKHTKQSLKSMSSGEQKKALLNYILTQKPEYIVLNNLYDNLDITYQTILKKLLIDISENVNLILIISRQEDVLPIKSNIYKLHKNRLTAYSSLQAYKASRQKNTPLKTLAIPKNNNVVNYKDNELIRFKNVSVAYNNKQILNNISWSICKGDFWQLIGKNGSGKTTLLSMITGENSKGYGQELYLFGNKKGTGESIWDIKKKIGYFTPSLVDSFKGNHSLLHMIIGGFTDAIGLYTKPTETQKSEAEKWLKIAQLSTLKNKLFNEVTVGQQRLTMLLRAMVKQPLLLILDEPTAGLDDESATLFINLVNQIASNKQTAIVFVSHRQEPNLEPRSILELKITPNGSYAKRLK